jgi:hypothetical protein
MDKQRATAWTVTTIHRKGASGHRELCFLSVSSDSTGRNIAYPAVGLLDAYIFYKVEEKR